MDLFTVADIDTFFKGCKNINVEIVAADYNTKFPYPSIQDITKFKRDKSANLMLVMGSEGKGIADDIKPHCDKAVYVSKGTNSPDSFPYSLVDSLNVSVSSGILLQNIIYK